MEKEFVPYELALKLKKLGFNKPCFASYTVIPEDEIDWFRIPEQGITDKTSYGSSKNYNSKFFEEEGTISAPTFSQAFRWFREKYKMAIINPDWNNKFKYKVFNLHPLTQGVLVEETGFQTYEEAELACLDKLIEIVESKSEEK